MKILMIAPYVTMLSRPEFSRNKTGFGYMVNDIARIVGEKENVDVLCTDSRGDAFAVNNVNYINRSFFLYCIRLRFCISFVFVLKLVKHYKMHRGTMARLVYYWFLTGYLSWLLRKKQYDIVHIHGCGFSTELWINVCKKLNQKYVVTLHGLVSFSETVKLEKAGKQYERDFLKRVVCGEIPITVISSGMKRIIEETYCVDRCPNITVVCNSFLFPQSDNHDKIDIRLKYGIASGRKILLCVGNIGKRKNQGQLIMAFNLLAKDIAESTYILFLGENQESDYSIKAFSKNTKYKNHFIECGPIDKLLVQQYYEQADGVVLISLSEGFGLSLIEGMHFGLPCVMFRDMDAFEDIYDERAVIAIEERTDKAVAQCLEQLIIRNWNKDEIKESSTRFEAGTMAKNYIDVYRKIIS